MNVGVFFGFLIYFVFLVYIGWWVNRYIKIEDQYFVGGRKVYVLVVIFLDKVSDFFGWLMLGYFGSVFKVGFGVFWVGIGCFFGMLVDYVFIGLRFRIYVGKFRVIIVLDYLEVRFKDDIKFIRIFSVLIIIIFMIVYVVVQFVVGGKIFVEGFDVSVNIGIIIIVIILIVYVIIGGFFVVVWIDVVQVFFMLLIFVIVLFLVLVKIGGFDKVMEIIVFVDFNKFYFFGGVIGWVVIIFVIGYVFWIVGYFGQFYIVICYMSVEDLRKFRRLGIFISGIWIIIVFWGVFFVGFFGFVFYQVGMFNVSDFECVVFVMVVEFMLSWIVGFVIVGIIFVVMSIVDFQFFVVFLVIVRDFYYKVFGKEFGKKQMVNIFRVVVVVVVLVGFWFVIIGLKVIYQMVVMVWGGFVVGFGLIFILSFWWKCVIKEGGIVGMVYGLVSEVIFEVKIYGWVFNFDVLGFFGIFGSWFNGVLVFFINFFIMLFVIIIVSFFIKLLGDIVKFYEEFFRKVFVEGGKRIVMEIRVKSQVENVVDFLIEKGFV